MEERRKLKRVYLMFYTRVFDRKTGRLLGNLADITPEGAMIIHEEPIEVGQIHLLRMDLPDGFKFPKSHLDIEARSVWSRPDIDPRFLNTGFHFQNVSADDVMIIEGIMESYALKD